MNRHRVKRHRHAWTGGSDICECGARRDARQSLPSNPVVTQETLRNLVASSSASTLAMSDFSEAIQRIGASLGDGASFRNPAPVRTREPTPEEALQVIFDYLERVAAERPDALVETAGKWISQVTNGIADILRKHEDDI